MDLDISSRSPEGLLTLLNVRGVGPKTACAFATNYDRLLQIFDAGDDELQRITTTAVIRSIRDRTLWTLAHDSMHRALDQACEHSLKILTFFEQGYPDLLRSIPNPPPVLYCKGTLRNDCRFVACVGTRNPSHFGTTVAQRITKMLVENRWGIVSGLAIGIDAECHTAAIENGGYTVAILANGLDDVYPKKNKRLAEQIVETGGALISEQPPGIRAFAQHLVQRDRLQSGMSVATIPMQTAIIGGTMHTVRFTLEQHRLLFVPVPTETHADDDASQGILALAERTGKELANCLGADKSYGELLRSRFRDIPPAIPIRTLEDYPGVISRLEKALAERTDSQCAKQTQKHQSLFS